LNRTREIVAPPVAGLMPNPPVTTPAKSVGGALLRSWILLAFVATAAVLFVVDRQVMSLLKTTLGTALGLTDVQYGWLITAFMTPYTVMYLFTGGWVDRWGTRAMSVVFIGAMSVATIMTGLSRGFSELVVFRILLGVAEAGIMPAAILFVVIWFPKELRATAVAVKSPIATIGTVTTPPLVAWITLTFGWRLAFIVPGVIGLFVAAGWWLLDRNPPDYAREAAPAVGRRASAFGLLRERSLWPLLAVRIVSDPLWFFILYWHAPFLQEHLGISLAQVGKWVWIPPLAAAFGNLGIGMISDRLVRRGLSLRQARTWPLAVAAILGPLAWVLPWAPQVGAAVGLIAVIFVVCNAWIFITNVFVADLLPRENVATGVGLLSAMGGATSALFNLCAGWVVAGLGYTPLLLIGGCLHPIAAVILWRAYGRAPRLLPEGTA
jgi:ACS family hexuronate transporter-like MFS transporter